MRYSTRYLYLAFTAFTMAISVAVGVYNLTTTGDGPLAALSFSLAAFLLPFAVFAAILAAKQ